MDAKLQSVILEYGAEGYGLYWYCLELIAANVDPDNLSFELEHDARIIARNLGMGVQRCEDIMKHMVNIGLFEASGGMITCMKLAKRADDYTAKLVRSELSQVIDCKGNRETPTNSDKVQLDKIRLDKNRIENNTTAPTADAVAGVKSVSDCPHQDIINLYHEKCPTLRKVKVWSGEREKHLRARWRQAEKHQSLEFWASYFEYVAASDFLIGNAGSFSADLEWLVKPSNFIKVVEGKYDNRG
jgi:hypothetical protein